MPVIHFERATRRLSIDADKATTLNDHTRSALRGALVIAAEKYEENRAEFMKLAALNPPEAERQPLVPYGAAAQRVALQFGCQADDVRALIALIDGDDEAEHDTAVIFVAEGMHN